MTNLLAYTTFDSNSLITNRPLSATLDTGRFIEFISWFSKARDGGFIFSLNQDLLIENNINNHTLYTIPILPVLKSQTVDASNTHENPLAPRKYNHIIGDKDIDDTIAEFNNQFSKDKTNIYYIKMHGSQNWFRQDDEQIMIIGRGKSDRIKSDKLLNWYADLFKNQLSQKDVKLLVIGYSFGDEHINQEIYESRENLSIYIVNPQSFKDFAESLNKKPLGAQIFSLIKKYYPVTFSEMLGAHNGTPHFYWDELSSDFNF